MHVVMLHSPTSFASHILLDPGEDSLCGGVQSLQGFNDLAICVLWWQIMEYYLCHVMPHKHSSACGGSLLVLDNHIGSTPAHMHMRIACGPWRRL